jgi:hypothetical protein
VLQKSYECLTCHKQIRIAKIDNVPAGQKKKWEKYELDGITLHVCHKHPPNQLATKEQPKQQPAWKTRRKASQVDDAKKENG